MSRIFRSSWARLASGFNQTQIKINPISRRICHFSGDFGPGSWRSVEGLVRSPANFAPLSPISFLERAARVCGERTSVVYGNVSFTWNQTLRRCVKLASALTQLGISRGDVVATLAPNIPAMCELHFAVPMAGAVLCTLNTRHDSAMISSLLRHSSAKVLIVDYQFLEIAQGALSLLAKEGKKQPLLILIPKSDGCTDTCEYETLVESGSDDFEIRRPENEFDPISLNYTSGTTSRPKGVVYSHRGAYLNTLGTVLLHDMGAMPVYLWTVPMFHCNGWCLVWGVAAQTGTNICIRRVSPREIFESICMHGVNYMGGAPTVLNMIVNALPTDQKKLPNRVVVLTGGAPPPPQVLSRMEELGFEVIHIYGLTEVYGPSTSCVWKPEWNNLSPLERSRVKSRQGVQHTCLEDLDVKDPLTMESVPSDGTTLGEIMFKGNTVMSGYLNDARATNNAFSGGWFHSGDLAVKHADGYIEMKDRIKDIVISGGENVSSMEVETVLYGHPAVLEAAVVARPDRHWGQTVCAFVKLKDGFEICEKEVIEFCRERLPHYMAPKTVVFDDLPKTSTGKVQKFVLRERATAMGSLS